MNALTLLGDEATNAQEPNGFLTTIAAPTVPTAEATFADYAGSHAGAVDGIHASMEGGGFVGYRRKFVLNIRRPFIRRAAVKAAPKR